MEKREYPESQYYHLINFDFGNLSKSVVNEILWRFEDLDNLNGDYNRWRAELISFLDTIPEKEKVKTLIKAVHYGKKVIELYTNTIYPKTQNSNQLESFDRRIELAMALYNKYQKKHRLDFNNWLMGKPHWREVSYEYNTEQAYQHKQDLKAVFWNCYVYFEEKVKEYFGEFKILPIEVLNELIFRFRQDFPKSGRVEGINYFDDLLEQLIDKYPSEQKEVEKEDNEIGGNDLNKPTLGRQVLAIHYLLEHCDIKNVDKTAKARFVQLLTGRELGAKAIQNTTIYKKVSNPFSTDNKTLNADLQFIRTYFENLGLNDISQSITNEISKSDL